MANGVLLIGWKRAIPGREQQALDLFQKVIQYYATSQSAGKIESFEPVLLNHHGGDLNGFVLIKGDIGKLSEFRLEDTFVEHAIEAGYCLDGFGIVGGFFGEKVADTFALWSKHIGK